jgi:hypothetical protein
MTSPAKNTAKNAPAKPADKVTPEIVKDDAPVVEAPKEETSKEETPAERIPTALVNNPILAEFCNQYLKVVDEISKYNKEILSAEKSEWNVPKVLDKARELGRPTDASVKANESILSALKVWEESVNAMNRAKRAVVDATSKELGITLSATAERDPAIEAPMKDRRKLANEIGTQLSIIANMTNDTSATAAVNAFLEKNPLPAIGRDQVRTFGGNEKATPKYRVNVRVTDADGNVKVDEAGFTKASFALTKFYPRGEGIKSDKLREVWEAAGNNADSTTSPTVEFTDNDLHFVITKK